MPQTMQELGIDRLSVEERLTLAPGDLGQRRG